MDTSNWTYGCEYELADWDTGKGWLEELGFKRDPEPNIGNTNGIAADPSLKSYRFGGEINTPPSDTPEEQLKLLDQFLKLHTNAVPTYRSGLHVHIRVPGLTRKNRLPWLKKIQRFISQNIEVYPLIDSMPEPMRDESGEDYVEERRRWNWMKMSHWTKIPLNRVERQMCAKSVDEFFELEVPTSKDRKKVLWHAQPRAAINLRQLKQTDTIEFRHFTMSTDFDEVLTAIEWCRDYLELALSGGGAGDGVKLYESQYAGRRFPTLSDYPFAAWKERRWRATSITKNSRHVVNTNIAAILNGEFDLQCLSS